MGRKSNRYKRRKENASSQASTAQAKRPKALDAQGKNAVDASVGADSKSNMLTMTIALPEDLGNLDQRALQVIAEGTMEFLETLISGGGVQDASLAPSYSAEDSCYFVGDSVYQENDVIWIPLEHTSRETEESLSVNADALPYQPRCFNVNVVPSNISDAYLKARFIAFGQNEPGFVIICHGGEFWHPCQVFQNPYTGEIEFLSCIYNAAFCLLEHRNFYATLDAEIGNLGFSSEIRYARGAEIDWGKRFQNEVEVVKRYLPSFDPFADPYDPNNIHDDPEWQIFYDFPE